MKISAGLLMYRIGKDGIEVLLAHPGGPFWQHKDAGAWTIPKGLTNEGEAPLEAAQREFREETGLAPAGPFVFLGSARQMGGKVVHAFAFEGDCDPARIASNSFELEWPSGSGKVRRFPEIDRAGWFALPAAREKIVKGQAVFLDRLAAALEG